MNLEDKLAIAEEHILRLTEERDQADEAFNNIGKRIHCAYCGLMIEDDSPDEARRLIIEHVVSCDKNTFRIAADEAIEERNEVLKLCKALSNENDGGSWSVTPFEVLLVIMVYDIIKVLVDHYLFNDR